MSKSMSSNRGQRSQLSGVIGLCGKMNRAQLDTYERQVINTMQSSDAEVLTHPLPIL